MMEISIARETGVKKLACLTASRSTCKLTLISNPNERFCFQSSYDTVLQCLLAYQAHIITIPEYSQVAWSQHSRLLQLKSIFPPILITDSNAAAHIRIIFKLIPQLLNKQMRSTSLQQQKYCKSKSMRPYDPVIYLEKSPSLNKQSVVTDNSKKFESERISLPFIKSQSNRSQASPPKHPKTKIQVIHKFVQEANEKKKIIDEIEDNKIKIAELEKKCKYEQQKLAQAEQQLGIAKQESNLEFMKYHQKTISDIRSSICSTQNRIVSLESRRTELDKQLSALRCRRQ